MTTLNYDHIAELVRAQGVPCYVEQTGGGVATLYAGPGVDKGVEGVVYPIGAGPGSFGWGQEPSTGDTDEFYIVNQSDDDEPMLDARDLGMSTDEQAAGVIVAAFHAGGPERVRASDLTALGLDALLTGFGARA